MSIFAQNLGDIRAGWSLRAKLGLGAAILGAGTLLTALILWVGLNEVAQRLDTAGASETRMARYATLSTQAATFIVVATEAVQSGQPRDVRMERLDQVRTQLQQTFDRLRADVETAVLSVADLGLDAQSRYGTQSLGLARMQAQLDATLTGLADDTRDPARLRAHIDGFASSFDPLLSQAVNAERLFRREILAGIADLRQRLLRLALGIALLTLGLVAAFYLGLVRPQFRRLEALRNAAERIADEDFAVALPEGAQDEIGTLHSATNRMAKALATRQAQVESEWARLNETIAQRTEDLRQANATLERIDEDRRAFFADISHELRTPLTVILMEAQLGKQAAPDAASSFDTIETRAARLNRRIDDLLRVARSDTGQLALEPQPVPVTDLMRDVVEEIRAEADNAGMRFTAGTPPEGQLVCDRNWLRQVLVSLCRNAIRHARAGGALAILADEDAGELRFDIIDNGPGIPAADQARVFDRFTQGGTGNAQGFGVGLALARWVIEAHGGALSLTSPVPKARALGDAPGTLIAVRLPREPG